MQEAEYHTMAALEQEHWWYRSLHHRVLERLEAEACRQHQPLEVFDAGCGTGGLLLALQQRAWIAAASGCDLHPLALAYARSRGLEVRACSVQALADWPRRFDVVLSMDVIYHREVQPAAAMAAMATLLRPGGLLLLNTAAMPCLEREHDRRVMGGRRFLPGPLRRLVEQAGLRVERLGYWNTWLTPLLWLQARVEGCRWLSAKERTGAGSDVQLPAPWLNRSLEQLLCLEQRSAALLPLPWGSSLMLSARKPGQSAGPTNP
jgi:SAM-dependent methyltransferase